MLIITPGRRHDRDIFSIFFSIKVHCVFSLESPHRGDSNEYAQYTNSQYGKENHLKLSQIRSYAIFSKGSKNEFESAVVNEPSVVEPLKVYCNSNCSVYSFHWRSEKMGNMNNGNGGNCTISNTFKHV